jgi:SAM-dependent methyltransferase
VQGVKNLFPEFFHQKRVLEVGSLNINGSIREFFTDCDYVGIDCNPGPDVDIVCTAHKFVSRPFDVVCACETFEHDPFADLTVWNMLKLLKPGGLFFATAAGEGRPVHGTAAAIQAAGYKHEPFGPDPNYYANITVRDAMRWLQQSDIKLSHVLVEHDPRHHDLQICAVKAR